jgi:methyl-accepting chemotaxis protein
MIPRRLHYEDGSPLPDYLGSLGHAPVATARLGPSALYVPPPRARRAREDLGALGRLGVLSAGASASWGDEEPMTAAQAAQFSGLWAQYTGGAGAQLQADLAALDQTILELSDFLQAADATGDTEAFPQLAALQTPLIALQQDAQKAQSVIDAWASGWQAVKDWIAGHVGLGAVPLLIGVAFAAAAIGALLALLAMQPVINRNVARAKALIDQVASGQLTATQAKQQLDTTTERVPNPADFVPAVGGALNMIGLALAGVVALVVLTR